METVADVFGRRVRALRLAKGWTQEDLARAARMDTKHIGAVERGEKTSSFDAVGRIAVALKVPYFELFIATPAQKRVAEHIRREVSAMLDREPRIDPVQIEEFLRALRSALSKLDRRT